MPTRLVNIPFALGQDESFHPVEIPGGALLEAVNVRQRQLHGFGVRADYLAQSMSEFSGTVVPYDLYELNGKLVALGDRQGLGYPTDVFTLVQQAVGNWRGSLGVGASGLRLPPITAVRDVGLPQEIEYAVNSVRIAAVNGVVGTVSCSPVASGVASSTIHIFLSSTNATLIQSTALLGNARAVAVGNSLWFIGVDAANDLVGYRYDTTTATGLAGPTTLYTGTVTSNIYDVTAVKGAATFQTAIRDGATITIRRFNEAGAQVNSFAGPAVAPDVLAVEADSTVNRIALVYRVGAADVQLQTYSLTGTGAVGPTGVFGVAMIGDVYVQRRTAGVTGIQIFSEGQNADFVRVSQRNDATNASTGSASMGNKYLAGRGICGGGLVIQPMQDRYSNQLVVFGDLAGTTSAVVTLAATHDSDIADIAQPGFDGKSGGDTCLDASTGKGYWARLVTQTDGQVGPLVAEFAIKSTARRTACQVGNALLISGGAGLHYDGRQTAESGYPERAVFSSTAPLAGGVGGALIPGATYDYVAIYKYQDANNNVTLSKVSDIVSVTLGAAQNSVAASVHGPLSLRVDPGSGSASVIELYRTHADRETTTALISSSRDFSLTPAVDGDFNLQTLQISVDGGATQTVTFGATDNTVADIVGAINTQTTGCTATADGGVVSIETDTEGAGGSIAIIGGTTTGTGASSLGFFVTQNATGTSTFVKSTVFQRVATKNTLSGAGPGQVYSIADTMSDATLLSQAPLYTNAERGALSGILEHEAPPPFEFCTTVGKRAFIGGLPDRSEVRISKELFPGESLAFCADSAFRARIEGDCTGVATVAGTPIAFTADSIFVFPTSFPNDNGDAGSLGPAQKLDTEEGCTNPDSIATTVCFRQACMSR